MFNYCIQRGLKFCLRFKNVRKMHDIMLVLLNAIRIISTNLYRNPDAKKSHIIEWTIKTVLFRVNNILVVVCVSRQMCFLLTCYRMKSWTFKGWLNTLEVLINYKRYDWSVCFNQTWKLCSCSTNFNWLTIHHKISLTKKCMLH